MAASPARRLEELLRSELQRHGSTRAPQSSSGRSPLPRSSSSSVVVSQAAAASAAASAAAAAFAEVESFRRVVTPHASPRKGS
jgi:hypothetical protein